MSTDQSAEENAYVADRRRELFAELADVNTRLAGFRRLLDKFSGARADYSLASLDHLERLLIRLRATPETHKDLLLDAGYYIGETLRRAYQARWEIGESEDDMHPNRLGAPLLTGHSLYEDFYPFEEVYRFTSAPAEGFFNERIRAQVRPA